MSEMVDKLEAHYAKVHNSYRAKDTNDVYLVYGSGYQVLGIFSDKAQAQKYLERVTGYSIGVMTIDAELPFLDTPLTLYRINVTRQGHITAMYKKPPPMYKSYWHDDVCYWEGYAENADDAISAALEYAKDLNSSQ
jgi:hypothetical protein